MLEIFSSAVKKPFYRYAMAVGAVATSFLLRFAMIQYLSLDLPPFVLSYPAVMVVAILGGLWPGLLATVLAALLTDYFAVERIGHFTVSKPSDAVALAFFAGIGGLTSLFAERYRKSEQSISSYKVELALQKSKQELQHASEFSQLALDAAGLGTWEFLPELDHVSVDETCLKLLGFQTGEAYTNEDLPERIHPDDRSIVSDTIANAIAGADGGLWGMEYRVVWPDGSIHWLTSHGRAYFTGEGESRRAVRLIGVNMDVTDRKMAEEAGQEREKQLYNLANSIPQLCWMANADGWIFWYNQRFYDFTGKTPEQMEGWGWQSVHDPDALPGVLEQWKNSIATKSPFEMTFPLRGADGVFRSFLTRVVPVLDADGKVVRWFGTNTDITDRKRTEDALRESELLYRGLFDSMDEGFCIIEVLFDETGKAVDFRLLEANASYERQTGIRNPVGKRMREIAPLLEEHWFELYGKVALTGEPAHLINEAKAIGGYYDVRAYRVGAPELRHVAVVFNEISARMREEKALRQQAELLDLAHDTIMVRDLDGTIRFWNNGAREMYGFSSEEAKGRIAYELLSALFPQPLAEIEEIVLRDGRWEGELTHIARNGARIEVASRWALQRDMDGKPISVMEINNDISERKRAEEHTRRLNRVYAVLSDINKTIVREKDSQAMLKAACDIAVDKGKFLMAWIGVVDPASHELKPIASSGMVGGYLDKVKIDFLDPITATGPAARCFHSGKHSICNDIEHELFRPWKEDALRNGYRSMAAFPLQSDGQIIGIFKLYACELAFFDENEIKLLDEMAMDVSFALEVNRHEKERQKADEELRWRTAFFEAMVDSAFDGIMVVNTKGDRPIRNQRLADMFRIPEDIAEIAGNSQQRKFVESMMKKPDEYLAKFDSLNSQSEGVSLDEIEMINGTILERSSAPVIDRAKVHYGRIWTFRDITERRQLEEQFRQAQKMEAIGQLTGGIAHDFNNLLTVILGCSEVMSDDVKESPRLSKMAEMITSAAQRGADLTHRMLAFARRQSLQPKTVNINLLLSGMESFLRRTLTAEIELHVTPGGKECDATVDPTQLESALLNLCVNARDAMPGGGRLTIETGYATLDSDYAGENPEVTPGEYILIAVSDTGSGISPENLRRVFDPFFTTKEVGKGTGLGLSMVYGFVKQSKGHVKIYSEPGLGTSVKLYLPKATQKSEPANPQRTPFAALRGSETILLVEDNDPVREIARAQLVDLGYKVFVAANGKDAMEQVRTHANIDLLFTDMAMPGGMNGRDLANKASEIRSNLKVLICSGYADNAMFHEGPAGRELTVLNKPYTRLELAKKIREVLTER